MGTTTSEDTSTQGEEINADALQAVIDAGPPDEEEEQRAFEAAFGGEENPAQEEEDPDKGKPDDGKDDEGKDDAQGAADGDATEGEAPIDLAAEVRRLNAEIIRLSGDNRKLHGRYGDMNTRLGEILQGARSEAVKSGAEVPGRQKIAEAMKSAEKMDALREEYPEWGDAIEELVLAATDHVSQRIPDPGSIESMVNEMRQKAYIDVHHPDWEEKIQTPEFKAWFDEQDEETRELASSDRGVDAVRMLDLFEKRALNQRQSDTPGQPAEGPEGETRSDALRKAMQPTGRGARRANSAALSEQEEFERAFNS